MITDEMISADTNSADAISVDTNSADMTSSDRPSPQSRTQAVAHSFGRRAGDYSRHAHLQQHTAQALAAFVRAHGGLPEQSINDEEHCGQGLVVEIGCGTGLLTELLHQPGQPYLATDLSPEMLAQCRSRLGERPGLGFAVLDGQTAAFATPPAAPPAAIVSNLACQWFADPVAGLVRLARQTPLLAFSVPLAGSFPEWEAAFADLGRSSGLLPLPKEQDVLAALASLDPARPAQLPDQRPDQLSDQRTGQHDAQPDDQRTIQRIIHHIEVRQQHFPSAKAFADSFRLIGADQPRPGYAPAPIRPVLRRFANGLYATTRILYCLVMRGSP